MQSHRTAEAAPLAFDCHHKNIDSLDDPLIRIEFFIQFLATALEIDLITPHSMSK